MSACECEACGSAIHRNGDGVDIVPSVVCHQCYRRSRPMRALRTQRDELVTAAKAALDSAKKHRWRVNSDERDTLAELQAAIEAAEKRFP